MSYLHSAVIKFDFKTPKHAEIAARTMNVDDDLKPEESTSSFRNEGQFLFFEVKAASAKHLKKAINTTTPSIQLVERTINAFAVD